MTFEMIDAVKNAADELGCRYTENTPLCSYTTFSTGGKCPLMIELNGAASASRLTRLMKEKSIPYYVIGKGSNLIADDRDIDMIFLHTGKDMSDITQDGNRLICGAGASLAAISARARDLSLTGLEFAHGIPGNAGGAVFMNAGAYGGEIKDVIVCAEAVDREGNIITLSKEEMALGYRHSIFKENGFIITKAVFELEKGVKEDISAKMAELAAMRKEKQPLEFRSAGSTFKRPQGAFAAALIEQCGLKGYCVGDAQVSEKHSGFVINKGHASFEDIMAVIAHVRRVVEEQTGYILECEPEIISTRSDREG